MSGDRLRILFLTYSDEEGAASRGRVYQYLDYFRQRGIHADVRPFYSPRHYRLIMSGGSTLLQVLYMIPAFWRRIRDVLRAGRYDVVFFQREAVPFGPLWLEWIAKRLGARTVFDLDDATFAWNPDRRWKLRNLLRKPERVGKVMASVDWVCAGNDYIADYARARNPNVAVIGGAELMERYDVAPLRHAPGRFVIGWTGSISTEIYLDILKPALTRLAERIPNLSFVILGGGRFTCPGVDVVHLPWTLEDEIARVRAFDVGVMPLPDLEWSRGKCGGKARVYMAAGVPPVVTAIGYNCELIRDGVTGILVRSEDDWFDALSKLYENPELRTAMGANAQAYVRKNLSLEAVAPQFEAFLQRVAGGSENGR